MYNFLTVNWISIQSDMRAYHLIVRTHIFIYGIEDLRNKNERQTQQISVF